MNPDNKAPEDTTPESNGAAWATPTQPSPEPEPSTLPSPDKPPQAPAEPTATPEPTAPLQSTPQAEVVSDAPVTPAPVVASKRKTNPFLIVILIVVLVGGAAYGAWYFLMQPGTETTQEQTTEAPATSEESVETDVSDIQAEIDELDSASLDESTLSDQALTE